MRWWREIERWIEQEKAESRTSAYPLCPLSDVLQERREPVQLHGALDGWQAITIKFSGEVLPRERAEAFKGAMFAAYPGDLAFSKIDARNGAIGLIPPGIAKAVVTSEYPVFIPRPDRLRADYLHHLLRADHFTADLQRKASGTSGRKRVTPESFLSLKIPVPTLDEQDALIAAYADALTRAARLEQEAETIERAAWRAFEDALGLTPPPPLPDKPVFIARFQDLERWSHEGILRATFKEAASEPAWPIARLGDLVADLENGWSPKCHDHPAREGTWGVLKLGAVSFGVFDASENKELPANLKPRREYEIQAGDVLISRANVVRYVGACVHVDATPDCLMLCDKIFRVRFHRDTKLLPRFLPEAMKLPSVRLQIESRLTGTSPTMKNIAKPALLDLEFPVPELAVQERLVTALTAARVATTSKRTEAAALRAAAWSAFESALFTPDAAGPDTVELIAGIEPRDRGPAP